MCIFQTGALNPMSMDSYYKEWDERERSAPKANQLWILSNHLENSVNTHEIDHQESDHLYYQNCEYKV